MANVLILRSVSLQQLDQNLPAVRSAFPGAEIHLLTHPHALAECRKFPGVARVLPLASARPFAPWRLPPEVRRERYAAVVVPVANRSGAGFLNVFLTAWASGAAAVFRCNLVSELMPVSRPALFARLLAGALYGTAAAVAALLLAAPALLALAASRLAALRSGNAR